MISKFIYTKNKLIVFFNDYVFRFHRGGFNMQMHRPQS